MRLWSLHPSLLDAKGLVACWREALLAQKVLSGQTRGYAGHPQLARFKAHADPMEAIGLYLVGLWDEAHARGYNFDRSKIARPEVEETAVKIPVHQGQVQFEFEHLRRKLEIRDPAVEEKLGRMRPPWPQHPLFTVVPGPIEIWEKDARADHGAMDSRAFLEDTGNNNFTQE